MSSNLRSSEMSEKYRQYREGGGLDNGCVLCQATISKGFKYWKVVNNEFPYDLIAEVHHMLVPIRHIAEVDISNNERQELLEIKDSYVSGYDYIVETTNKTKSIPQHYHLHLIISKDLPDPEL